jgi:hypothetical protein
VSCTLPVRRDTTTESKQIDLLVGVVVLQNAANLVDDLQVLVFVHVPIVQTVWVLGVSVRQSEINGN